MTTGYGDAYDGLTVINADASPPVVEEVITGLGRNPAIVALSPDGSHAYVTNCWDETVSVINTETRTVVATVDIGVLYDPIGVAVSSDGAWVYVTNAMSDTVTVIDASSNSVIGPPIPVGASPGAVAVSPDNSKLYVACYGDDSVSVIDTDTYDVTAIADGAGPCSVVFSPDGTRAYVTNRLSATVSVIDVASDSPLTPPIDIDSNPIGLAISPDGARIYVTHETENSVTVIDCATNTIIGTVGIGSTPHGIAVSPDGLHVYVANPGSNTVSVLLEMMSPVVLVHGYWKEKDVRGPAQWGRMKDLLESPEDPIDPAFEVAHFDYTSAGTKTPIEELADLLAQKISLTKAVAGVDKVDVVAYSMGGLIVRRYIANGGTGIRRFVQIASPNYGSDLAKFRNTVQAKQMRYASKFLYDLHVDESRDGFLSSVDYLTVVGARDFIVPPVSAACANFSDNQRVVPYGHLDDIVKVDDEQHETLRIVRSFLAGSDDWRSIGSDYSFSDWSVWVRVEDSTTRKVIRARCKIDLIGPSGYAIPTVTWERNNSKTSGMYYTDPELRFAPTGHMVRVKHGKKTEDSSDPLEAGIVNVLTFQFD